MKTAYRILILFFLVGSFSAFSAKHFWRGTTMSISEAEKRWGNGEFEAKKFKNGDARARASMAASILKKEKDFRGKTVLEIREMLGMTDGFYFTDVYPAYLVQIGENHSQETWQVVFLLNNDRKVDSVIIHKNCCS